MRKSLMDVRKGLAKVHAETHSAAGALFKEFILGGQDGLVNVLGVILGLAAATSNTRIVVIAGLAAAFAESFSMAAVAYTSAKAEEDYFASERARELFEIDSFPDVERKEIYDLYQRKGFRGKLLDDIVDHIVADRTIWLDIMMREELGLSDEFASAAKTAVIVGSATVVGSFIPLTPFFFLGVKTAAVLSLAVSALALFVAGAIEGKFTVGHWAKKGLQLAVIGMVAALIGFVVGKVLGVS
jgi:VIT1/CCC1 family predicted Fe2+/Mn2+ transporter